jgi:hypothetical protein
VPIASTSLCNEVSAVLWWERDLLDGLTFTLEVQRLVLLPGRDRWLARASRGVEESLDRLRQAELVRAVRVARLALELDLDPSPSLRVVVAALNEPWNEVFAGHLQALREATGEVRRLADHNRLQLDGAATASFTAPGWLDLGPPRTPPEGEVLPSSDRGR